MCKIEILPLLAGNTYPEAGAKVFDLMRQCINNGHRIELDLAGIDALPSMFLNVSLGRAVELYGVDKIKSGLMFSNITTAQIERIKQYISHFEQKAQLG